MRIEFTLRFRDYVSFTCLHQFLSIPVQICMVGACLLPFIWNQGDETWIQLLTMSVVYYLVAWTGNCVLTGLYLFSSRNGNHFIPRVIELQDKAFFEETRINTSYHYWPGIVRVMARPGTVAVYVSEHQAFVIPNTAFSSAGQRADFIATVRQKILAAKSATA
jgi:hypothetical protein